MGVYISIICNILLVIIAIISYKKGFKAWKMSIQNIKIDQGQVDEVNQAWRDIIKTINTQNSGLIGGEIQKWTYTYNFEINSNINNKYKLIIINHFWIQEVDTWYIFDTAIWAKSYIAREFWWVIIKQ